MQLLDVDHIIYSRWFKMIRKDTVHATVKMYMGTFLMDGRPI